MALLAQSLQTSLKGIWPVLLTICLSAILGTLALAIGGSPDKWTLILPVAVAALAKCPIQADQENRRSVLAEVM
jgi:hypothetical protein